MPIDRKQGRLFSLVALFVVLYASVLSLSPAVRARSWQTAYRWDHWIGVLLWLVLAYLVHVQTARWLPGRDPYLLPIALLLSGWGILTIWRLLPSFGMRQSLWLFVGLGALVAGLRLPSDLGFLRRYKYLWLTGSLLLTGLTLVLGTNPLGYGPRMWLGCCGVYLQPSEPLKLLFIAYLAAYMADRQPYLVLSRIDVSGNRDEGGSMIQGESAQADAPLLPLLAPTLIMIGLALALLVVQRDLGTASIFFFLYAVIVYVTTGRKRVLVLATLAILVAGVVGYLLFDVVRLRVDAWLNPWIDPSGRSYQVIQSLIAIANGGLLGRGPGVGSPGLVPVAHSDLIYAAVVEEHGLAGAVGLLVCIALLAARGLRAALHASNAYHGYLAAGLTAYLAGQSLLIIGGTLRLVPLTGVTLPFISYGGSSLLTSFLSLLLLSHITNRARTKPAAWFLPHTYLQLGQWLFAGLAIAALATGWWVVYRAPELVTRTDNPRRAIADRFVLRGSIYDRSGAPISVTLGRPAEYQRHTLYAELSNVVGYTDPTYGQSGLEASVDGYLRGLEGNPASLVLWNNLLYGQPPPGLDVHLSLDLALQRVADRALGDQRGALILLDPQSGQILAMASHPAFDANRLEQDWERLVDDPGAPLLNRVTQGQYAPGAALGPVLLVQVAAQGALPPLPVDTAYTLGGLSLDCAGAWPVDTWAGSVASGCPGPVAALGETLGADALSALYRSLGLYRAPRVRLPTAGVEAPQAITDSLAAALGEGMRVSPLQVALALSTLSAKGARPAPSLVVALDGAQSGWQALPALEQPSQVLPPETARQIAAALAQDDPYVWGGVAVVPSESEQAITWYVGGTSPGWEGAPLLVVALLEIDDPGLAADIGLQVLRAAMLP